MEPIAPARLFILWRGELSRKSVALIDVNEFEVAIINLVVNARDAMPDGGRIKIVARNETIEGRNAIDQLRGEFVVIVVEDDGNGIAAEDLPKVYRSRAARHRSQAIARHTLAKPARKPYVSAERSAAHGFERHFLLD